MSDRPTPTKLQVFLCHASGDKAEVRSLYQRLKAEPWLYPWLDEEELLPGQEWREEIEKAVEQSQAILVCLSPASITKEGFVQREIRVALEHADDMPEGTIYIIPLKLQECEIPRRLSRWQWANYFEERGHEKLLRALRFRAEKLGRTFDTLPANPPVITSNPPPAPRPNETEQERLLWEINDLNTSHERRRDIGDRLAEIGDTRPGVGVGADGLPDILWLPVEPGGTLNIEDEIYQVQPFKIAKYPITYAQYEAFVQAKAGFNNLEWWQGIPKRYKKQELHEQNQKAANHPRDTISWYQAVAFTRWLTAHYRAAGKLELGVEIRLPTEWEWQWAAQGGTQQRKYPWGEWREGYSNTEEAKLGRTVAVGMYPQGAALCEAEDMAGNIWEWCLNKRSNDGRWRGLRGGSFFYNSNDADCAARVELNQFSELNYFGFRVVIGGVPIVPSEL